MPVIPPVSVMFLSRKCGVLRKVSCQLWGKVPLNTVDICSQVSEGPTTNDEEHIQLNHALTKSGEVLSCMHMKNSRLQSS